MVGLKNSDSIQILWNSASDVTCGAVTYHVQLRVTVDEALIREDTTNNLMYLFTDLSSDTHYTASVYGSNEAGDGDTASVRVTTTSSTTNNNNDNDNNADDSKHLELVFNR